jgi:hypothetical protein
MARLLSTQFLLKMRKFGNDTSDDSSFEDKKKETVKSYTSPEVEFSRKNLLSKLEILTKFHKDNEILLSHRKIGWALIYEFFFEKLFFIDKSKKKHNIYINLHEIELHIRKEISKIKENKSKNESEFTIFNKIVYNPPISSWYANNFLNTETNKLISAKDSNSYITNIINNFSQYEKKKVGKNIKKKNSFGREGERKKTIVKNQNNLKAKRNSVRLGNIPIQTLKQKQEKTIDFLDNKMNNENNFLDNYSKNYKNETNEENYYNLNQIDVIPKNAKKGIENYCQSKKEKNPLFVEEEINNILNEEKCYNVELRNSNIFANKFMDKRKFLIDFNFYQNAFNKHKIENSGFNLKSEINQMFNKIDNAIELASNFKTQKNNN